MALKMLKGNGSFDPYIFKLITRELLSCFVSPEDFFLIQWNSASHSAHILRNNHPSSSYIQGPRHCLLLTLLSRLVNADHWLRSHLSACSQLDGDVYSDPNATTDFYVKPVRSTGLLTFAQGATPGPIAGTIPWDLLLQIPLLNFLSMSGNALYGPVLPDNIDQLPYLQSLWVEYENSAGGCHVSGGLGRSKKPLQPAFLAIS